MAEGNSGQVKWTHLDSKQLEKDAGPKYSRLSESIRHLTPGTVQCSMFCGGRQCKYENPSKMKDEEMAVKGLYSTWITDNIMAMARPSTEIMKTYNVIEQFTEAGIRSVMNLQRPGEHASCGYGLEQSGFSYVPEDFMQAEIFFYNFGWNDYGVRSLESILDMVKVMSFALQEGKAAVHCHAGLGRTGVLISCFFIYSERLKADEAIHKMRTKRPKAVQTRGQIECVNDFASFVSNLWVVFASGQHDSKAFTLQQYLIRQKRLLHGFESRHLKYLPKIVYSVCSRLLELGSVKAEDPSYPWSLSDDIKNMFTEGDERSPDSSLTEQDTESFSRNADKDSKKVISRSCSVEGVNDVTLAPTLNGSTDDLAVNVSNRQRRASDFELTLEKDLDPNMKQPSLVKRYSDLRVKENSYLSTSENGPTDVCARRSSCEAGNSATQKDRSACTQSADERIQVARALAASACADAGVQNRTERLKRKLNSSNSCWEELKTESDPWVLTRLLWAWLEHLSEPVMSPADVKLVASSQLEPLSALKNLHQGTRKTLECLITTIHQLGPLPEEVNDRVLRRVSMVLTHNRVLSLTFPRASLDALGVNIRLSSKPDQPQPTSQLEEQGNELDTSGSVASSQSYRLLMFLRQLMTAVRKQRDSR